nr:MFS transporter [Clostridiales bacterium]
MNEKLHKLFGTTPGKGVQPKEAISYSITGFGQNFICTIIGSYLTVFITDALLFGSDGVKIGSITGSMAVAFLMLFTRVYDGMNDPIMGSIVDKTRTKYGKCRPFLKWMAVPIALTTILCFLPVWNSEKIVADHSYAVRVFLAITVCYVIWTMVYTVA